MLKSKNKIAVIAAIAVIASGVGIYHVLGNSGNENKKNTVISLPATERVEKGNISEYVTASGTVNPSVVNGIYIETTQKVSNVLVNLGDSVKMGDVLVEYDVDYSKKELENSLASQNLSLQSANLTLKSLTSEKTEAELLQLSNSISSAEKALLDAENNLKSTETQIESLKKQLEEANKNVEDNKRLLNAGAISQETYNTDLKSIEEIEKSIKDNESNIESLEKSVANAENSLKQANLNYESAKTPLSDEASKINYNKQLNEIEKTKLSIQNIKDQISDLIEASVSHVEGTVIELNVEEGSIVNNETSIMKIADLNNLIVNANVSEYDVPLLKIGQKVSITTDAIADKIYEGEITYISPVANVTNTFSGSETTVAVEVSVSNPDSMLKPGYSVDLEILVTDVSEVPLVSLSAVQKDNSENKYYVFTVDESKTIHKTYVEKGAYNDMNAQIISGLSEGDEIITSPTANMQDNTPLDLYATEINAGSQPSSNQDSTSPLESLIPGGGGAPSGGGGMPSGGGGAPSGGGNRPMGRQ